MQLLQALSQKISHDERMKKLTDGPIPWPPCSADIIPSDFFLWGYLNDIVYRTKVRDINDLQHRIIEAIDTVTVDMLPRTWQEIEYQLDMVRATDGVYVEVY